MSASIKRKLEALNFPNVSGFDSADASHYRSLVGWVEDQVIRLHTIEDRIPLRDSKNVDAWESAFVRYLTELGCPFELGVGNRLAVLDWVLAQGILLEYTDKADELNDLPSPRPTDGVAMNGGGDASTDGANPLEQIDFNSPAIRDGVHRLAKLLSVQEHTGDHLVTLEACAVFITSRLGADARTEASTEGTLRVLDEFPLGFTSKDSVVDRAARVLRLLHVNKARELQTKINRTIVAVQNVTADPRTDDRLGKVGRK